tara:strand:- start:294 stop:710 length:417 start_codon:yes stop_codon:yes gene_type:complete
MIENFGNILYLIIHILITGLFGVYLIRIYFAPEGLVKEFNVDRSGIYLIKFIGTFAFGFFFIGLYIIFRPGGPEGAWVYFNLIFLIAAAQLLYESLFYFKLIDKDLGAKNSITDLVLSIFMVVSSVVLIWGLSDKIYL